ncbi:protein-disulfide reductase DsbD domain-containing protein [Pedobacter nyackensis]|uniref:protein-disulfide reductase DsbD domain-containing protein n=1 Tax=Pedobacter nyackensis TaxID=475255 RepID=UPI00292FEA8D|nr:protein-disulfide reductase DsbD domain-containing protein [Pedobacter nyackensis]
MKRTLLILLLFCGMSGLKAQILRPVKWTFTSMPIKGKVGLYEVRMTAMIDKGWHIYSQATPEGGPSPTVIKFKPNPLLLLGGKVKELGKLHKEASQEFGVDVWSYDNKVEFVQIVKLKKPYVKTSLSGTVEFMACDSQQCLPPEEIEFNIPLK